VHLSEKQKGDSAMNRLATKLPESARLSLFIGFEAFFLCQEFFFCFWEVRVLNTAINGADCGALWLFVKTDTLGAFIRNDVINAFSKWVICFAEKCPRLATFVDGGVRTFRFASGAVNALLCDHQSHVYFPPKSFRLKVIKEIVWDYKKPFLPNSFFSD
jgi:hypothetical protein